MYLVQFLLPLFDNDGERIPRERFSEIRDELTERFGGMTSYLRSPAEGTWKEHGGDVARDEMVMCEVMVDALDRSWWSAYRTKLEKLFVQQEIVVRATLAEKL